MIITEPCAGLGNRLLGLCTSYALSKRLERELVVVWKREIGCNIRADELFQLPMRVVEVSENGYSKEPLAHFMGNRTKKSWRGRADLFLECDDVEKIKEERGYDGLLQVVSETPCIYFKTFGPVCEPAPSCFSFLKPAYEVEERGRELFGRIGTDTVGVHVRRSDHTEAIANSPLALFAQEMRKEADSGRTARFFIATDDAGVRTELKKLLPDLELIFYEKGVIDRNSKEGLIDAMVEMLALSRCRKILGSYNSTFSLLPSMLGNVPLLVIKKQ